VCVCVAMITVARDEKLKSSRELKLLVRYNGLRMYRQRVSKTADAILIGH